MSPPRQRTLTRRAVVTAALRIVDRDGTDALTMRALGRELGVDPMAAYNHVPNKSAVLDGIVEAVWSELELPDTAGMPWPDRLEAIAHAMRRTLMRHPNALGILATRPNRSGPGLQLAEATLSPLLEAGVAPLDALAFINAAASFIIGHALAESGPAEADDDGTSELLEEIRNITAGGDHPDLERVLGEVDLDDMTGDRIFETGIRALIAGIGHLEG